MDGDTPSGFTGNLFAHYRDKEPSTKVKPEKFGPKSLYDTFRGAADFAE